MKIYLDQSHLSNLARKIADPALSRKFEDLCSNGRLSPVFSMAHLFETWQHPNSTARSLIATFADSLANPQWILSRHILTDKEVERAFIEFCGYPQPPINPFRQKLKHILYENMRQPELVLGDYGFGDTLAEVEQDLNLQKNFQEWKALNNSYPYVKALLSGTVATRGPDAVISELRTHFVNYITDKIPSHMPDGEIVGPQQKQAFIKKDFWAMFHRCPSTYIMMRVDEEIARDISSSAEASQFVDLVHLPALPYVDLFLCDRRTRDYVRRTKIPGAVFDRCFYDLAQALAQI